MFKTNDKEKYKLFFYNPKYEKSFGENIALNIIHKNLQINGYFLTDFKLLDISPYIEEYNDETFYEKGNTVIEVLLKINTLQTNQKNIFNAVLESLKQKQKNGIFIDGPRGSGKSYLLNILIDYLKFYDIPLLCVAWTGIAANLSKNGKTVHTTFKLPLNITESTTCNVKHNSNDGKKFKEVQIIIWDEIAMTSNFAFKAVDCLLQDICKVKEIFGGKTVLVSGDFRQILPVVRHGSRIEVVENSVQSSYLWPNFIRVTLNENLRESDDDNNFKEWLLNIGEGKRSNSYQEENELIHIPDEIMTKEEDIITEIYVNEIKINDKKFTSLMK